MRATLHWARQIAAIVRRVVGAPDYDRYLAHMRRRHPDCAPLGYDEFIAVQLQSKYEKPGARCC
jgi:uncharacterized short protein YbdD (DUF466 family)